MANKKKTTTPITMKGYKGFNSDWTCRDKQYEVGKTYEEDTASLCNAGLHFVGNPADIFNYYTPVNNGILNKFAEVIAEDVSDQQEGDSKRVCKKLTLSAELSFADIIKARIQYVKEHTTEEHTDPKQATAGNDGAATAGYGGAATAGYSGAATAGNNGAATAGDGGAATSKGSVSVGENGCALTRGNNVKARGGLGAILVLCEENSDDFDIKVWKAFVVDGDKVKADTWYGLDEDGELMEVEA